MVHFLPYEGKKKSAAAKLARLCKAQGIGANDVSPSLIYDLEWKDVDTKIFDSRKLSDSTFLDDPIKVQKHFFLFSISFLLPTYPHDTFRYNLI